MMNPFVLKQNRSLLRFKKLISALLVFCGPFTVGAQDVYDLSRCVTTGLEQNYSVKVVRNQELIADNNYSRGNAGYLPSLSTTNWYSGYSNTTTQNKTDGTRVVSRGIQSSAGSAAIDLDMTLFDGFNVQASYKKLNELKQVGALNTQMAMENLVAQIVSEYYYQIQQLNYYNNMAYAVALSRERVRIDEHRYLLGASSKLDLLQSIVYLNADSSQLSKQNEEIRTSEVRLKKLMAMADLRADIVLKDSVIANSPDLDYENLLALTLEYNTSLQIAKKSQVISQIDYKIIASRSYPYLNFSSGYTLSYNDYGTGLVDNQNIKGVNYGLTLGMDLFDGHNRRRERANAIIEIENQAHQYQEVEQEIKAELLTVYYAFENNLQLLKLEEQNLEVARENLEIALERYRLGDLSGLELREVQKSLLDAKERLISVKFQTKLAEISLLQISGQIMDYV
jgi:outer membrane protein TolC